MTDGLHWLASSERERQQALELARALQQRESLDELGIGSVRDALANRLFPGTSTLHTRARYHLFIPWAYQQATALTTTRRSIAARVREAEAALIVGLKRGTGEDGRGLIGRDAGAGLRRMPSAVYWQGLHVWGIRRLGGPQSAIERALRAGRGARPARDDDGEPIDTPDGGVWHPNLPEPPSGHPEQAEFRLTFDEAEFLTERLTTEPRVKGSPLAELVRIPTDHSAVGYLWEHPSLASLAARTQAAIEQARRFSLLMFGAAWIYNIVLADLRETPDQADEHRANYDSWAASAEAAGTDLVGWNLEALWETTGSVPLLTKGFVTDWQALLRQDGPLSLRDAPAARELIIRREQRMKGQNARTLNRKALEQWGGISGGSPLDFRWSTARLLIDDIRDGLERADAPH